MCGITGFLDRAPAWNAADGAARVRSMALALSHRGPDDSGEFVDPAAGIALGFRRLSIVDLSPAGHQPMTSASGRYTMIFNGEVYNFERIRAELRAAGLAPEFRGHSDTEVQLAAFEAWGVEGALSRFIGMFAIVLWDRQERALHLIRDRLGVKPLYFGWQGNTLLFGSELKALRRHPRFDAGIDRGALALLLRHNCIPAPFTIYKDIRKVMPGTFVTIDRSGERETVYWSAAEMAERGAASRANVDPREAAGQLEELLRDAVGLRMIADVPLGVFLSGGVDSSAVAAMMQVQSAQPVKTFTIGFTEPAYNEADQAREVARHLGTDHTELIVTPQEALGVIPRLAEMFDEPFADSSQIPTYLEYAIARQRVTVALSGDGGDELFGGYNRYVWAPRIWKRTSWSPRFMQRAAAAGLRALSPNQWDRLFEGAARVLPRRFRQRSPGDKLLKVADALAAETPDDVYWDLVSHFKSPERVVRGAETLETRWSRGARSLNLGSFTDRMMYLDLITYLPDDILVKVDRASMAVSLEAREPLLDHRLVEFAWTLPLDMKVRGGVGKWILREVLYRHVPRELIERPKAGFGIPIDRWLRGPLRDWAESLLDRRRLAAEGFLDPEAVHAVWNEHLSGRRNRQYHVWDVLMFEAWLEHTSHESRAETAIA